MADSKPTSTNTSAPLGSCLTHLETKGTHYDVGFNTGSHFRERIQLFFKEYQHHQTVVLPFYDSPEGREYYEENLRVCQDCFPHYVRELRGLANGAGLPFEQTFMANVCETSITSLLKMKQTSNQPQPKEDASSEYGCSTLFIHSGDSSCQAIVHNEDHHPLVKKYGYLLTAHIVEEEAEGKKVEGEAEGRWEEKFTSFCNPGSLPGRAFNVNHRGLVFTSNVLRPAELARGAPSRIFHSRSILSARDIPEAVKLARNDPYGTAYGFTANLSTKEGQMTSLEIGPGKPQAVVHVQGVTSPSCGPDARSTSASACHYYHFNAYQHLKVPEHGQLESSIRRALRVNQLPDPRGLRQALDVMADTEDQVCPLYRTPRPTDQAQTVCTAVLDVLANQMRLYGDREELLADTPALTLPLFD